MLAKDDCFPHITSFSIWEYSTLTIARRTIPLLIREDYDRRRKETFGENVLIRKPSRSDVEGIAKVYLETVRRSYIGLASDEYLNQRNIVDCIAQWTLNVDDPNITLLVAEIDGMIVGLASFGLSRDHDKDPTEFAEIHAIYVAVEQWGRGIGWQLCKRLMSELYGAGHNAITLWVFANNTRATKFYERAGFVPDGTSKMVTMGKQLVAIRYCHKRKPTTT